MYSPHRAGHSGQVLDLEYGPEEAILVPAGLYSLSHESAARVFMMMQPHNLDYYIRSIVKEDTNQNPHCSKESVMVVSVSVIVNVNERYIPRLHRNRL